ncbi:Helicase associated domain protein [Streptomyces sp. NPDC053253]|uniref:Helicase associated domain protein n=1 Tax=Streptomyces sp. NPDC053253 TaxID=3365699 RepID=UPI0037D64078
MGGAAGRIAPLNGELTLSFLHRIAARYHLGIREVLAAVTDVGGLQNLTGMLYPDSEIHLNAQARERVAALCRVPQHVLEEALPAWRREEPCGTYGSGPVGRLMRGEEVVAAWGPACPACTAARTGRKMPARRYLAPEDRVCARHRYWLLYLPHTGGLTVPLGRCPEVIEAQRRHARLLHRSPIGAQAFEVARAVTNSWWEQPWPRQEHAWPARLDATRPDGADPGWWKVAARDLITYPETVALARVLASRPLQQRAVAESSGHLPYRLGELPGLLAEVAGRLGRPWLIRHLAIITHGPLFAWAHSCVHTRAASTPASQRTLWKVHSSHRPRPLSDLLPPPQPRTDHGQPEPRPVKRLRGHSLQAERAFERSLVHTHAYHQQHGHLAVPKEDSLGDYPLGAWLSNLRTRHTRLPAHQAAALHALYPWWNAPWSTLWQRTWHQARDHAEAHGPLKPTSGFPTTSYSLGEWLYLQCTRYPALHPEQQRLLTQIGIDAAAAAAARPRRRNLKAGAEEALAHARSYAAEHGSLTSVTSATVHEGFRLGQWLANQRNYQRTSHRPLPAGRAQALAAIDPWWCPPWNLKWQRSYHRARNAAHSQPLRPSSSFIDLDDSLASRWLRRQCSAYEELHDGQQRLLAEIGITTEVARTTREHAHTAAPKRPGAARAADTEDKDGNALTSAGPAAPRGRRRTRRATEPERPREPRSRLGHRPDLRPGFETALAHARAWQAEHGHLAVPRDTLHDGYRLGWWLFSQRNRAKQRARDQLPPSPHLNELTAIDLWWNPPWDLYWQRNYYRARDYIAAGEPFDPVARIPAPSTVLGSWITRACLQYAQLHPDQQHLLNAIGITARTAEQWPPSPRPRPHAEALTHARTWTSEHGHLCPPIKTIHDGFPLGEWLNRQRELAKKRSSLSPTQQALATIDPWWNPPWPILWQRAYHQARTHPRHPATRHWAQKQQRGWLLLHPDQQHLLTTASLVAT